MSFNVKLVIAVAVVATAAYGVLPRPRAVAAPDDGATAKNAAQDAAANTATLEAFKKLAGQWVALDENGKPTDKVMNEFRVTAAGSAVIETVFPGQPHEMITMYYMDGKDLMLTHYCALGNQPHMKAEDGHNANHIVFQCDCHGGNLKTGKEQHMHRGAYRFLDDGGLKTEWTLYDGGKEVQVVGATLVRRPAVAR